MLAGIWLAATAGPLCNPGTAQAQDGESKIPDAAKIPDSPSGARVWASSHAGHLPDKPTIAPSFAIQVDPLGFTAPGPIYLGMRFSLASLDFLDENKVLFTFRVPGLIRRQAPTGEVDPSEVRHVRAVVLALPSGNVLAEALWTLHDRSRYLWMLKDGHFLLRDGDELRMGDDTLELKPYLRFPGPLESLALGPGQQFLVTNSVEPTAAPKAGETPRPATASAEVTPHDQAPGTDSSGAPSMVVRILSRDSGKVMLVSRVRSEVRLPINSEGYLEGLRGRGADWLLNLNHFTGGVTNVGHVDSTCSPAYDFVSQREFVVTACNRAGEHRLVAMATDGRRLWEERASGEAVWPLLEMGSDGSRLLRESLVVNHLVNAYAPISGDDIKGQLVEVFDAAGGNLALAAQASPVLDAGGNAAISPSGRRVAVLNAGAIQIFDLPAAPPLPDAASPAGR